MSFFWVLHLHEYFSKPAACEVEIGDFVVWESQGVIQWTEPRRVVYLELKDRQWWVWCDGSMTAIRAKELVKRN